MINILIGIALGLLALNVIAFAYILTRNKFRNPVRESFEEEDGWTP